MNKSLVLLNALALTLATMKGLCTMPGDFSFDYSIRTYKNIRHQRGKKRKG